MTDVVESGDDVFAELTDVTAPVTETVEAEEKEAEEPKEQPAKEEAGEAQKESEVEVSTDDPEEEAISLVPVAALKSERQKRQEAEKKLREYEAKTSVQANIPNRDEDPDGYELHVRVAVSRDLMAEMHPDYIEKATLFQDLAANNPVLQAQFEKHKSPAKFAYETAKEHLEVEQLKEARRSPEWSEFQKWKEEKAKAPKVEKEADARKKSALSVPNLNKATSKRFAEQEVDDDVFAGAAF